MSYMRMFSPYRYVEGTSEDYIFETGNKKENWIEDYGSISNETIVELLLQFGNSQDDLILIQMGIRLAENLGVKLRKKPLTIKQWFKESSRIHKKLEKEFSLQDDGERSGE